MSKLENRIKQGVSTAAGAAALVKLVATWHGSPLATRGQKVDAGINLAGLPFFKKQADGKRWLCGFRLKDLK